VLRIHDCREFDFYHICAESRGTKYFIDFYLSEKKRLHLVDHGIFSFLMGCMFKSATIKACQTDLDDIKRAEEFKMMIYEPLSKHSSDSIFD